MSDPAGKAWLHIARELAPMLPGDWCVLGGTGAKAVLVRQPVEWTFAWVGLYRVRVADDSYLMSGLVPLVNPVHGLSASYGLRSDEARQPGTVDPLSEDARGFGSALCCRRCITAARPWTQEALARAAEDSLCQAEPGGSFELTQAAGWRVVNDSGSPVEAAEKAIEWYRKRLAPDAVTWYEALIDAWSQGERLAALAYLEEHRQDVLTRLKLA